MEGMRNYLTSLNTIEIIHLKTKISYKRAILTCQNKPVPVDLLIVLFLLREQIYERFELIRIILMAVPETMAKIKRKQTQTAP